MSNDKEIRILSTTANGLHCPSSGVTSQGDTPIQDRPEDPQKKDLVESEPYLGPAWAVAMLILYILKEAFPAAQYSLLWWIQNYVIALVVAITIFTLIKRHQFYKAGKDSPFQ